VKEIAGQSDLEEARSQPRSFVFLWVNWATRARLSEEVVRTLVESWNSTHPELPAPVYRADLSKQSGEVWESIREWLRSEGKSVNELTYGGYGALLWLKSGSVAAAAPFAAAMDYADLLSATRALFVCGAR
jgi:hypothetical protein